MRQLTAGLVLGLVTTAASAATPSPEEMWAIIQQQQAEIARLKEQVAAADEEIKETGVRVDATASMVEEGLGSGRQSLASSWAERTQIGSYGEMHYNNLDNQNGDGGDKDELDFHRFVFFLGHEFSDTTRMFSEVELEHSIAGDGQNGEVELEQAYIEHDLSQTTRLKAGLFLVPVGLLNLTHEPDTFYGVERNNVEKNIIPTTWWEGGLALSGEIAPGWSYDTAFTSGLKLNADEGQWQIRDGRQKVSEADASDPAYTANLKYTGVAGLELGATVQYQQDIYQGEYGQDVDAMLYSAHVAWRSGPFGLRAVAASWDIDDAINTVKAGADTQEGWYVEPSWLLLRELGIFARYSEWDNQAGGGGDTQFSEWNLGFNYWLEESVVFKLDYQFQDAPSNQKELDGLNLGVGWSF
ncbi:MAG: OprO/OprP family phosphate-selective porin [Gammaproteobacteria bacterium]|nr:OprO/OprP family phosphate-selective porin [Gammaproteobacteria bacterium]